MAPGSNQKPCYPLPLESSSLVPWARRFWAAANRLTATAHRASPQQPSASVPDAHPSQSRFAAFHAAVPPPADSAPAQGHPDCLQDSTLRARYRSRCWARTDPETKAAPAGKKAGRQKTLSQPLPPLALSVFRPVNADYDLLPLPVPHSWATRRSCALEHLLQMPGEISIPLLLPAGSVPPNQKNYRVFPLAQLPAPLPKFLPVAPLPAFEEPRNALLNCSSPLIFPMPAGLASHCGLAATPADPQ